MRFIISNTNGRPWGGYPKADVYSTSTERFEALCELSSFARSSPRLMSSIALNNIFNMLRVYNNVGWLSRGSHFTLYLIFKISNLYYEEDKLHLYTTASIRSSMCLKDSWNGINPYAMQSIEVIFFSPWNLSFLGITVFIIKKHPTKSSNSPTEAFNNENL